MEKKLEGVVWENYDVPSFGEFLRQLDDKLMEEIENEPTGIWAEVFVFFDSNPKNSLTPREFFEYWNYLTETERLEHVMMFG